jgi:hypothetical protein
MTLSTTKLSIMTQRNNTQRNDTQHNDNPHNDTQHNDTQLNKAKHIYNQHFNTQHNDNQNDHKNLILSIMIHACWVSLWGSIDCFPSVGLNKFKIQFYVKTN